MNIDEILAEIKRAYPQDVFPDTTQDERDPVIKKYPGFIDRTSAMMGRHLVNVIREKLAGGTTPAPGDSASAFPPGVCFNCGLPATHKTDTGLFICGEHASLALVAGWKIKPLPEPLSA